MFALSRLILICFVAMCVCCAVLVGALFGPPVVVVFVLVAAALVAKRGRSFTAFGTARWAAVEDLQQAGMMSGNGLIVGTPLGSPRPRLMEATLGLINPFVRSSDATS